MLKNIIKKLVEEKTFLNIKSAEDLKKIVESNPSINFSIYREYEEGDVLFFNILTNSMSLVKKDFIRGYKQLN